MLLGETRLVVIRLRVDVFAGFSCDWIWKILRFTCSVSVSCSKPITSSTPTTFGLLRRNLKRPSTCPVDCRKKKKNPKKNDFPRFLFNTINTFTDSSNVQFRLLLSLNIYCKCKDLYGKYICFVFCLFYLTIKNKSNVQYSYGII